MKLSVTIKQQNPEFDKEYAEMYNEDKEGESNWKDLWSVRYDCGYEVNEVRILNDKDLLISAITKVGDKLVEWNIPNMTILEALNEEGKISTKLAVSTNLLKNTHKAYNKKYDTTRFYFYLNERKDFTQIFDGYYVLNEDLPEEIIKVDE